MANAQVEKLMKLLDITEAEALDVIEQDKAIDQGKRTYFDLDKDKEKEAKKMANVKTKTVYKFTQRERKPDEVKEEIISELAKFFENNEIISAFEVEITNKSREVAFKCGNDSFSITLTRKRAKKG